MIYEYQGPGAPKGIPAAVTGAELNRIHRETGAITPAGLVEESRPKTAPLHSAFEWNDKAAAVKYRETQARQIIRSVVLVSQPEKGETAPIIRAFVSLSSPEDARKRYYKPAIEALSNPDEAEEVKRRLRHELEALRRRYKDILEVSEMLAVAQTVLAA